MYFKISSKEGKELKAYCARAHTDAHARGNILLALRVGTGTIGSFMYAEDTYDALLLCAKNVWNEMGKPVVNDGICSRLDDYERPSAQSKKFFEKLGQSLDAYVRCQDSEQALRSRR
jgi:hypothetical protein